MEYRLLSAQEIEKLEAQYCSAADWSLVEVAKEFVPDFVRHTRFSGKAHTKYKDCTWNIVCFLHRK